jgi:hypothetical protein
MRTLVRRVVAGAAAGVGVLSVGVPAASAGDFHLQLPAGQACTFGLDIDGSGGHQKTHNLPNGQVLTTGTGSSLTFTNTATGKTITLPSNGAVSKVTNNADGTTTNVVTGHQVIILGPGDTPAGPSTTLYVGRVVYTADANQVFTVRSTSGRHTDICQALT